MKVDILEDCDFSPNGIAQQHCKSGEKCVEIRDDVAIAFIGYGFCKECKPIEIESKSIKEAPENKMLEPKIEDKEDKVKSGGKSQRKNKSKK